MTPYLRHQGSMYYPYALCRAAQLPQQSGDFLGNYENVEKTEKKHHIFYISIISEKTTALLGKLCGSTESGWVLVRSLMSKIWCHNAICGATRRPTFPSAGPAGPREPPCGEHTGAKSMNPALFKSAGDHFYQPRVAPGHGEAHRSRGGYVAPWAPISVWSTLKAPKKW